MSRYISPSQRCSIPGCDTEITANPNAPTRQHKLCQRHLKQKRAVAMAATAIRKLLGQPPFNAQTVTDDAPGQSDATGH